MNGWLLGGIIWLGVGATLLALWARIGWVLHADRERARLRSGEDSDDLS